MTSSVTQPSLGEATLNDLKCMVSNSATCHIIATVCILLNFNLQIVLVVVLNFITLVQIFWCALVVKASVLLVTDECSLLSCAMSLCL